MLEEMSNSIVASTVPYVENIPINEERPIEQKTPMKPYRSGKIVR